MRILVTGSTGFVGNNVARMLLERGDQVVASARPTSNMRSLAGLDVEIKQGDLTDPDFIDRLVDGVDAIVHSAALIQIGWSKRDESLQVNVESTRQIAAAALRSGIRFVHVSTVDTLAYANRNVERNENDREPVKPQCSYVVSKTQGELATLELFEKGLDVVVVHPGFMVGPWDWAPSSGQMMLAIAKNWVPFSPGGGCSVVDVRDVARGIIASIERGVSGERYILAGKNMTYLELWRMMASVVGKRGPIAPMGWPASRSIGFFGDVFAKLWGREGQVNSAALKMGQLHHYYSSQKAMEQLGYQISDVKQALVDAWQWFIEHGYVKQKSR
jgi:dihydroflavonol-4-reductase